jgi:hypothetical protein
VPPRVTRILLIALAITLVLYLVGYLIFNSGGTVPGTGTGEIVTGPTP